MILGASVGRKPRERERERERERGGGGGGEERKYPEHEYSLFYSKCFRALLL